MSVRISVASHLRLAKEALDDASKLGSSSRNAVYLIEQAVEQMVLALAQVEAVHYGRGQQHQIETMVSLLPKDNAFVPALRPLTWLEAYATTYRYPRAKGGVTRRPPDTNLDAAISRAEELLGVMARYFVVDLDKASERPAGNIDPPREIKNDGGDGSGGGASSGPR